MVTTARRIAKPVSLLILILLAVGPGLVWAGPPQDPDAIGKGVTRAPEAADLTSASPSAPLAAFPWIPAEPRSGFEFRSVAHPPRWFDTSAPSSASPKSGSWWSRRTTAQKTWFIVGMVVGAYGIYAIVNNSSNGNSNGGGGGGY